MYTILYTNQFKRQLKLITKRGYDIDVLNVAIQILSQIGTLPVDRYKTHKLLGKFVGCWEAHLKPDWLIVWYPENDEITITMTQTGTHADLFE